MCIDGGVVDYVDPGLLHIYDMEHDESLGNGFNNNTQAWCVRSVLRGHVRWKMLPRPVMAYFPMWMPWGLVMSDTVMTLRCILYLFRIYMV